ncbi:hypothetical protein ACOTJF_18415 [Achromobacter ruhlandii]|uniref:hypothetical protein n=1 Tax=Achromobacter ruhlandii TaxID=72557 RepID=UPI003B9EF61F
MSVIVRCADAQSLFDNFKKRIGDGTIATWKKRVNAKGVAEFYHTGEGDQWAKEAHFTATFINEGKGVRFNYVAHIVDKVGNELDVEGVYKGRLSSTLIANMRDHVISIDLKLEQPEEK